MVTKWKNIAKNKMNLFFEKGGETTYLAILCGIIATVLLVQAYSYYFFYPPYFGTLAIVGAGFLAIACHLILKTRLIRFFKKRHAASTYTQDDWHRTFCKQQRIMLPILVIVLFIIYLLAYDSFYWFLQMLHLISVIAMVFILVCEITTVSFMLNLLKEIMAHTEERNQKIIDASVEASIKSEQLKVDLISNVSHDLKTPLTSMVGYIDLIKKEELSDTMTDYVEILSSKTEKLKEMIESLFSLAKTSSGNIELKPESLQLNRLVEQICADMSDQISASDLEFVTELTTENTELVTDSSYLYRICQNLIENALKYSAPSTRVFLKTISAPSASGQLIRFEITNTSRYRMNFTKEQIVERFTRGDEARSTEGNGLGLAIANTYSAALGAAFDVNIDCDQFKATVEFTQNNGVANS